MKHKHQPNYYGFSQKFFGVESQPRYSEDFSAARALSQGGHAVIQLAQQH